MVAVRSALKIDPSKTIEKANEIEVDDQHKFIYLVSCGIKYARAEFEDFRKLFIIFDREEVGELLRKYDAGEALMVDFRLVVTALNEWKTLLTMVRTIRDVSQVSKQSSIKVEEAPIVCPSPAVA